MAHSHRIVRVARLAAIPLPVVAIDYACKSHDQYRANAEESVSTSATASQKLWEWLRDRGDDVDMVELAQQQGSGWGLLAAQDASARAKRWWREPWRMWGAKNVVMAEFPLSTCLTAHHVLQHPPQQAVFSDLLAKGAIDEHTVVVLHILLERLKGPASELYPWLQMLETRPLCGATFSSEQLREIQGTTLYKAARAKQQQLERQWQELRPVVERLVAAAQLPLQVPKHHQNYVDAYATYWSRACALPVTAQQLASADNRSSPLAAAAPEVGTSVKTQPAGVQAPEGDADPATPASPSTGPSQLLQGPLHGIVVGLDFCNHSSRSGKLCRWTVHEGGQGSSSKAQGGSVKLVCPQLVRTDDELFINYGDKSNEELLFVYGFAEGTAQDAVFDKLMLECPLPPPQDRNPVLLARIECLLAQGLRPQLFLPHLPAMPHHAYAEKHKPKHTDAAPSVVPNIPDDAITTLEMLVMEPRHLAAVLEYPDKYVKDGMTDMERGGLRLAALSTLMRLLEAKVLEQEASYTEGGTGTLESDQHLLEQYTRWSANSNTGTGFSEQRADVPTTVAASASITTETQTQRGATHLPQGAGQQGMQKWQLDLLHYRMKQKMLAREWLIAVRAHIAKEMKQLRQISE